MTVHKGKRITPRNFIPKGRLRAYSWHNRTLDQGLPSPHRSAIDHHDLNAYVPCDRERSKNTDIRELIKLTPRGAKQHQVIAYHPFNFEPARLDKDVVHTAPYMVTSVKRRLHPTASNPEIRNMPNCRYHRQGSLHDILATTTPSWSSIPGYTGHIRGKHAENVFGVGYATTNEFSEVSLDERRKPPHTEFRQTTGSFKIRCPQGSWRDQAYEHWKHATHGLTHQDRAPYGKGTEYRQLVRVAEQVKRNESDKRYQEATDTMPTWAANRPIDVRTCNPWRKGIRGHGGHHPKWKEDKDFFENPMVGKVYPPYYPEITHYSCIAQPIETPRDLNSLGAPKSPKRRSSSTLY